MVRHRVRRRLSYKQKRAIRYVIGLGFAASVLCALLLWRLNKPSEPPREIPVPQTSLSKFGR